MLPAQERSARCALSFRFWALGAARTHRVAKSYWIEALRNLRSSAWIGKAAGRRSSRRGRGRSTVNSVVDVDNRLRLNPC